MTINTNIFSDPSIFSATNALLPTLLPTSLFTNSSFTDDQKREAIKRTADVARKAEWRKLFEEEVELDWERISEKRGDGFSKYDRKTKLLEVINAIITNATAEDTEETLRDKIQDTQAYKNMKAAALEALSSYKTKRNLAIGGGVLLVGGVTAYFMLRKK